MSTVLMFPFAAGSRTSRDRGKKCARGGFYTRRPAAPGREKDVLEFLYVTTPIRGVLRGLLRDRSVVGTSGGGFFDSLLQTFENCRPGLGDGVLGDSAAGGEKYFLELYEKQLPRLREEIRARDFHLSSAMQAEIERDADALARQVVIPAYVRVATRFTRRERNDFFIAPEPFHALERVCWGLGGVLLGVFVVWAPFLPLWEKEWVFPFLMLGLIFPTLRHFFAVRSYSREINQIVSRVDRELSRIEEAAMMQPAQRELAGDVASETSEPAPHASGPKNAPP